MRLFGPNPASRASGSARDIEVEPASRVVVHWTGLDWISARDCARLCRMASNFPKLTLEQAVDLPNALQRNGGNPLSVIDLATAISKSPGSSYIRTLNAAASAYGLTGGSYKTTFTMKPLGQAIVSPVSPDERVARLVTAALTPPLFKQVYDYYKGKKVPDRQFLVNTVVREFKVPQGSADAFADIFLANLRFVGLIRSTPGGEWLANEPDPSTAGVPTVPDPGDVDTVAGEGRADEPSLFEPEVPTDSNTTPRPAADGAKRKRPNKLFVGHGRNKKPLEQLTKVLRDLGIPYLVAEDEPNAGRPISKKVRDTMEQCGAAILVFSADVEYFDTDGNSVWRPSENVSNELGAAAVMYDDRIIMFKEESISLASNYSGIGYITFEKDKLDAETNALLRELVALKILRLSVGDDE
jgi:predicted nucleotide-binding protein